MRIHLLNPKAAPEGKKLTQFESDIYSDLELNIIVNVASDNDKYLYDTFKEVLFEGNTSEEVISYRQEILKEIHENRDFFIDYYTFVSSVAKAFTSRFRFGIVDSRPSSLFSTSIAILKYVLSSVDELRVRSVPLQKMKSKGLSDLYQDICSSFSEEKVQKANSVIGNIEPENGYAAVVCCNDALEDAEYETIRSSFFDKEEKRRWKHAEKISFQVMSDSLLEEIKKKMDLTVKEAAPVLGQACESLENYFYELRHELSFYMAASNLLAAMERQNYCYTYPETSPNTAFTDLYDLALSMKKKSRAVGNTLDLSDAVLTIITGANQGGKTTFLRSYGQMVLFHQAGLPVPAKKAVLPVYPSFFTHFDKAEDTKMDSGKLDLELKRLSLMVDGMKKNTLLFLNEPFQSTNEHEGSLIGADVITGLCESGVKVVLVTHMYELTQKLDESIHNVLFLRAKRSDNGERSYYLEPKEPLTTSYGMDLFNNIFK